MSAFRDLKIKREARGMIAIVTKNDLKLPLNKVLEFYK